MWRYTLAACSDRALQFRLFSVPYRRSPHGRRSGRLYPAHGRLPDRGPPAFAGLPVSNICIRSHFHLLCGALAAPGHFVKSALLGVCFSTGFHAIRRVLFCREARTVSAFTLKAANLLNDMEPFRALLLSTASGFSP